MLPDGTVDCKKIQFGDIKLKAPSVYELSTPETSTEPQDTGIWTVQAFVDEFNLPTNDYYIVNSTPFSGTFSNSATTNSELKAYIFCSKYKDYDVLDVRLLEYGNVRVNNPYSKTRYYDIAVMDCDGKKSYTEGSMYSGSYDVSITDEQPILDALKKGGIVRLAISEKDNSLTKYVITIEDATGFSAAYFEYWNK